MEAYFHQELSGLGEVLQRLVLAAAMHKTTARLLARMHWPLCSKRFHRGTGVGLLIDQVISGEKREKSLGFGTSKLTKPSLLLGRWSNYLWKNSIVRCHDCPPNDVQALTIAGHQHADMVPIADQGQPRVLWILHVRSENWVPQKIHTILKYSRGSHNLHNQDVPAIRHIWPQVQGLGDTNPQVKDEGNNV